MRQPHSDFMSAPLMRIKTSAHLAISIWDQHSQFTLNDMCGRFARYSLSRELESYFNAHPSSFEIQPNYNVAPTQEIPVIVIHEDERHIKKRHWGLVPFWAKDISIGSRMINARVETVTSKPAFRAALKQRRCLIPANGFYEWYGKAGNKQPYYFHCLPVNRSPSLAYTKYGRTRKHPRKLAPTSPARSLPRKPVNRSKTFITACR